MELFHTYCLVHDDILDRGDERHGLATTHRYVHAELAKQRRVGDLAWASTSQAILVGDLLASWANQTFHQSVLQLTHFKDTTSEEVSVHLGGGSGEMRQSHVLQQRAYEEASMAWFRMQTEVILGQMIDIDLTTQKSATKALIDRKIWLKTASYSFLGPMRIGTSLAGTPPEQWEDFIRDFGKALGMAFQIQDDLREILVERTFHDISERQPTYLSEFVDRRGTEKHKKLLASIFGKPVSEYDKERLVELFQISGAVDAARAAVGQQIEVAEKILQQSKISQPIKAEWQELVGLISQLV
jgi:geranylgeranyl diphosphate synthase type I